MYFHSIIEGKYILYIRARHVNSPRICPHPRVAYVVKSICLKTHREIRKWHVRETKKIEEIKYMVQWGRS